MIDDRISLEQAAENVRRNMQLLNKAIDEYSGPSNIKELKSCPFCGGEAVLYEIAAHTHKLATFMPDYPGGAFIECSECTAALSGETKDEAIREWNRRVAS